MTGVKFTNLGRRNLGFGLRLALNLGFDIYKLCYFGQITYSLAALISL